MQKKSTEIVSPYEQVKRWILAPAIQDVISQSLPRGANAGAWTQAALVYVRTAPEVQKCEPLSTMGAVITVASLGLPLDSVMDLVYLRAMPVKKGREILRYEAQVQLGYKGMIQLAYKNKDVQEVEPVIVRAGDAFDFRKGTDPYLHHSWPLVKDRGEMVSVYAGLRFKRGYYSFQIYSIAGIMELREKILAQNWVKIERTGTGEKYFKKDFKKGWTPMSDFEANQRPWIGHLEAMILKTAVRKSYKFWPAVGTDFERAARLVELDDEGFSQQMADVAAENMPTDMLKQAASTGSYTPPAGGQVKNKTRDRGSELTKQMAAQAAPKGPTVVIKDDKKGKQQNNAVPVPNSQKEPAENKSPKKEPPKKNTNEEKPMSDEEIELALQREQEEWAKEQEQRLSDQER